MNPNTYTIAIDWGSSSFRSFLLDAKLELVDQIKNSFGVFQLPDPFENVLSSVCAHWFRQYSIDAILIAGAAGSREGWLEVPYVTCPVKVEHIGAATLSPSSSLDQVIKLFPGAKCKSPSGLVDVMRGEETLLLGAIEVTDLNDALVCLPGTHSKWAEVRSGQIASFATLMTGEIFGLLQEHGSIGALISDHDKNTFDSASFTAGIEDYLAVCAQQETSLLHMIFSMRAKVVSGQSRVHSQNSYLSGVILADEVYTAKKMFPQSDAVILITDAKFRDLYKQALTYIGFNFTVLDSEKMFLAGIRQLIQVMS